MAVILEVKAGPLAGKRVAVLAGQVVLVGRGQKANFAVPHDTFMSGVHFAVEVGPQGCRIADRKSSNGTFLNGAKINEALLTNGDEIRAGQTTFVVRMVAEAQLPADDAAAAAVPQAPPTAKVPDRAASPDHPAVRAAASAPAVAPRPAVPAPPRLQARAPAPAPASRAPVIAAQPKAPVLTIGSWAFATVPDGWQVKEEYGIERAEKDSFPSSVVATEEPLNGDMSLQQFVEAQVSMLRKYLREPQIEAALPPKIPGAEETVALEVRYTTKDGQTIYYRRVYARSGRLVGTITLTTLDNDLAQIRPAFDAILAGVAFQRKE